MLRPLPAQLSGAMRGQWADPFRDHAPAGSPQRLFSPDCAARRSTCSVQSGRARALVLPPALEQGGV
jgi:hypothetical protein